METRGAGPPLVLIPGIQGHWQWMEPTVEALAASYTVRTFSLQETAPLGGVFRGVDWLAGGGAPAAPYILVGVSFGGLIAAYQAGTQPDRVAALVLASVPGPQGAVDPRATRFLRHPEMLAPLFLARGSMNLIREMVAVFPFPHSAWAIARFGLRAVRWPMSPRRIQAWVREWQATDVAAVCARITAPTLVVTGEAGLDRVVPTTSTEEYLTLIPGATLVRLPGTGHAGVVSNATEFAGIVRKFADAHAR